MNESMRRRIGFSAFVVGMITLADLAEFLEETDLNKVALDFNEWLKVMPPFVLKKWDGVHYDDILAASECA